jgi:hypothetical protein
MDILEFAKKFTVFKPSPYHEAFFKMVEEALEKGESISCIDTNKYNRWYKDLHFNEFQYSQLIKMTEGQTFALASLEGIHIFKMIKFESYQKEEAKKQKKEL